MKLLLCSLMLAGMLVVSSPSQAHLISTPRARVVVVLDDDALMRRKKLRRRKHYSPF